MFLIWGVKTFMFVSYQVFVRRIRYLFARKQPTNGTRQFDLQCRRVSTHLQLYLQQHHLQVWTSTNSVCLTRSMNYADIICLELKPHQSTVAIVCLSSDEAAASGTLQTMTIEAVTVVLCQKQTGHIAIFCEQFSVDFRFGAEI